MRIRKIAEAQLHALCSELGPDDDLDPHGRHRPSTRRQAPRKTLQLCGQVARTLSALLAESADDALRDLEVVSVLPAPHSARLLVTVAPTACSKCTTNQAELSLERARGRLRTEVAAAVRRRRAPELVFCVVSPMA
jgi:ribosome-binding factor A